MASVGLEVKPTLQLVASSGSSAAPPNETARSLVGEERFFEIFLDCSLDLCEERDPKGLYKKARSGEISEFTGIDSPYEEPENPELVLDTGELSAEECARAIIELLIKAEIIERSGA